MPKKKRPTINTIINASAAETAAQLEVRRIQQAQKDREKAAALSDKVRRLEEQLTNYEELSELVRALEAHPLQRFEFKSREKTSRLHEATALMLLSDLHFEEQVKPEQVNGLNEFSLEIASGRMDRLGVGLSWMLDMAQSGYQIRDLIVACLGDIITNYLRTEDVRANFLTPFEAVIFAEEQIVKFVRYTLHMHPELELVYIPMVPGNHDRLSFSRSTPFTDRVGMSLMTVLAHGLAKEFSDDPRVKVELSPSEHHYTTVYGHTLRSMHGDRFTYLGGVGGIFIPARRHIAGLNKAIHAHLTVFGHWHTSKVDDLWVSNGSLIGPNAYSIGKGLDPEPPSQTFMLLDKERGKRLVTPIQVSESEGWS